MPASDHLAGVIVFVKAIFPADCYGPVHWRRVGRRCIIMRSLEVALQLDLGVAPYRILRLVQDSLALYNKKSVPKQRSRRGHWVLVHNDVETPKLLGASSLTINPPAEGKYSLRIACQRARASVSIELLGPRRISSFAMPG